MRFQSIYLGFCACENWVSKREEKKYSRQEGEREREQCHAQTNNMEMFCEMYLISYTVNRWVFAWYMSFLRSTCVYDSLFIHTLSLESSTHYNRVLLSRKHSNHSRYHLNRLIVCFIYSTFSSGISSGCVAFFPFFTTRYSRALIVKRCIGRPFCVCK